MKFIAVIRFLEELDKVVACLLSQVFQDEVEQD